MSGVVGGLSVILVGSLGRDETARGNGFTDLRIYPPPSPTRQPTRARASGNQVVAGSPNHLIHVSLDVTIMWAFTQAHGAVFGR